MTDVDGLNAGFARDLLEDYLENPEAVPSEWRELFESGRSDVVAIHFKESPPHASFDWHTAPEAQYVITLSGTLEFTTRDGETFVLRPGDVLVATDDIGSGHEFSINRVAALIGGPTVHTAPRGNDERFKRAGIDRARELLGWEPTVQLEEGIAQLLASRLPA